MEGWQYGGEKDYVDLTYCRNGGLAIRWRKRLCRFDTGQFLAAEKEGRQYGGQRGYVDLT